MATGASLVDNDVKGETPNKIERKKSSHFREKLGDEIPVPGLSEALKAKSKAAIILWAVVFVGLITALVYFTVQLLEQYNADPTATKVKMVRFKQYPFPPVILCIDTWLNAEKAAEIGLTDEGIRYSLSYLVAPYEINRHIERMYDDSSFDLSRWLRNESDPALATEKPPNPAKENFEEVYRRLNFSSLIDYFNFISLDVTRYPTEGSVGIDCVGCRRWKRKVIMERDVCYKIQLYSVEGNAGSASMWHEIIVRAPDLTRNIKPRKAYWRLYMDTPISKLIPRGPFVSIQYGRTHIVRLKSEHSIAIPTSKEPCARKDDPERIHYSAADCEYDCLRKFAYKMMHCTLFNLDNNFNRNLSAYCNIPDLKSWSRDYMQEMMRDYVEDVEVKPTDTAMGEGKLNETTVEQEEEEEKQCITNTCIPECDTWRYRIDVDSHYSLQRIEELGQNLTTAKILFVNGDAMAGGILTFTELDTFTFDALVGNVGGIWGLWTGASIVTLIQLVACCLKQCDRCKRRGLQPLRSKRSMRREEDAMLP